MSTALDAILKNLPADLRRGMGILPPKSSPIKSKPLSAVAAPPKSKPPRANAIPAELRAISRWLGWKSVPAEPKPRKLPIDPKSGKAASSTDPATWSDYDTAVASVARYRLNQSAALPGGIGFVFIADGQLVGIDLDNCRTPQTGEIAPWAQRIIKQLDSYGEVSPSGTGVKIFLKGKLPPNAKHNVKHQTGSVEMYDSGRYFTVTGKHVPGTPTTIEDRQAELTTVYADVFGNIERAPAPHTVAGESIGKGGRTNWLVSKAGSMNRAGMSGEAIEKALVAENLAKCDPPLPESKVRGIASDVVRRYPPGQPKRESMNPWTKAESLDHFLEAGEDDADFLDPERRILARESVTEIFSPRGLGKSLYVLCPALQLARRNLRVMYVDRDNPRHVIRNRLRGFGAAGLLSNWKLISREKCPPLTNAPAWAVFPYQDFDVVILDSFDSAAEGIGEQDSAKPSRAIAPVLDIARREAGPAVLILGNTIKPAQHSRGSGVIEDRADIVYEVRDATGLRPSGSKPWFEELPPADAASWALRASRRKQREKFRLAFVASKFRPGLEPEPFVLEIDLTTEPWTVSDVTGDVDREGAHAREQKEAEKRVRLDSAAAKLKAEITRRTEAGEPALRKRQDVEPFLAGHALKRGEARTLLADRNGVEWRLQPSPEDKRTVHVLPLVKNERDGHILTTPEAAKTKAGNDADCGRPRPEPTATSDPHETRENRGSGEVENVAETANFSPPENTKPLTGDAAKSDESETVKPEVRI